MIWWTSDLKIKNKNQDWVHGSSDRVLDGPEFKPQYHQTNKQNKQAKKTKTT
jgi:hypothetical protein